MSLSMGDLSLKLEENEGYLYVGDRLVIRGRIDGNGEEIPVTGIEVDGDWVAPVAAGINYLPTLGQVRIDWENRALSEIGDVNVGTLIQGQVLTWDSFTSKWIPSLGVAPDLSLASIDELQDVDDLGKEHNKVFTYDSVSGIWKPQYPYVYDLIFDYCDLFGYPYHSSEPGGDRCKDCTIEELGRITVVENIPYICLKTREHATDNLDSEFSYVRLLMDGYSRTDDKNSNPPILNCQSNYASGITRTDPIHTVAYDGNLGAL